MSTSFRLLENGRMEALAAIESLEAMLASEDSTVLLQIGGGASVRAKVLEPEKILIAIGAEVVVERTNRDAVEFLKERIMEMEASAKKVADALDRLRSQMNEINKRIESGYQQAAAEQYRGITGLPKNMFAGLREKLQAARDRLGSSLQAAAASQEPEGQEAQQAAAPGPVQEDRPDEGRPAPASASTGFVDKVRVLIRDRELVVSERDVADALSELEMTLLESDVALPATDAIIAGVRKNLVGRHRKIGESVDALVLGALKSALLEGTGQRVRPRRLYQNPRPPGRRSSSPV